MLMSALVKAKRMIQLIEARIDAFNKKMAEAGQEKPGAQDGPNAGQGEDQEEAKSLLGKR